MCGQRAPSPGRTASQGPGASHAADAGRTCVVSAAPTEAPSTRGRAETRLPSPFATAAELKARQRDAWEASSGLAEGEPRAAGPLSHEDKGQERGRPPPAPSRRPSRGRSSQDKAEPEDGRT